jgi:glutamine amidotransferase
VAGLGILPGRCTRLPASVKVPHVGWNSLQLARPSSLLDPAFEGAQVYFTHSYAAPITGDCVATSEHGAGFAAVVERGHVFGVQFHPEKSAEAGLQLLRAFAHIVASTRCSPSA